MDELYNLTNVSDAENILTFTQGINQITGGMMTLFILITLFIILVVGFRGQHISARVAASGFITALISMLFRTAGLTSDSIVLTFILITGISYVVLLYRNE